MEKLFRTGAVLLALWLIQAPQAIAQQEPADSARVLLREATDLRAWGGPEDTPRVLTLLHQAVRLFRVAGDREGELLTVEHLGRVYSDATALDSALVYYRKALDLAREAGNRTAEARTSERLGGVYREIARNDSALVYYTRARGGFAALLDVPAATRAATRVREARAVELLNSSPLLTPTMGVVAGARHVQATQAALADLPGFNPATIASVEQADAALEQVLSKLTVRADVQSVPPGLGVKYRRVLDQPGQEKSVTANDSLTLRPALYLFTAVHPRTGAPLEQKISCATNCNVRFIIPP